MDNKKQERIKRIEELMKPIDQQIMMCDDPKDLMYFASAMLASAKHILNVNVGRAETRKIFEEVMNND